MYVLLVTPINTSLYGSYDTYQVWCISSLHPHIPTHCMVLSTLLQPVVCGGKSIKRHHKAIRQSLSNPQDTHLRYRQQQQYCTNDIAHVQNI